MKKTIRVAGCILLHLDKLLLLFRSTTETDPSLWGIPAGKVEAGEADAQAIVRELFEETGVKLAEDRFKLLGELPIDYGSFIVEFVIFTATLDEVQEITLDPAEHRDYDWLTPKAALALPNLMKDVDVIIEQFCVQKLGMKP